MTFSIARIFSVIETVYFLIIYKSIIYKLLDLIIYKSMILYANYKLKRNLNTFLRI